MSKNFNFTQNFVVKCLKLLRKIWVGIETYKKKELLSRRCNLYMLLQTFLENLIKKETTQQIFNLTHFWIKHQFSKMFKIGQNYLFGIFF